MAKNINDPLESAKVSEDAPKKKGWGRSKEKAEVAPEASEPAPVAAAPAPAPAAPAGPPAGVQCYRVCEDKVISVGGSMTKMKKDTVISSQHYGGPAGIKALQVAGLNIEEV